MLFKTGILNSMLHVLKATGIEEPFSEEKLRTSIQRAGIPQEIEEQVISHVKQKLYDSIPTSTIYHHVKEFLKTSPHPYTVGKFSLKQAIMDLGPTGYPFEDYIADILKTKGYETSVRSIILGKCVSHEIDVIARKGPPTGGEKIMIEAKFHNMPGTKTNVHVALYTHARFEDVRPKEQFTAVWLITNTKITQDAISYAECNNMRIISWDYPHGESLRDLVQNEGLIPITALTTLSTSHKSTLAASGIVLVKDILTNPNILNTLQLSAEKRHEVMSETTFLVEKSS